MQAPRHVPLLATSRQYGVHETLECVHTGSIAVVDRDGRLLAGVGDPEALHFSRSTLKPLQALPFVTDGGMARFGFGSHQLAMMCASHSGETMHVDIVRGMLGAIDAHSADLQCGTQLPQYYEVAGIAPPPGARALSLTHNCSGKHSGFLAYCRLHRHRLDDYLSPESAVQMRVRHAIQELLPGAPLALGRDGCNAPNFALPLAGLARLYARLAADDTPELAALRFAMTRHPDLVSGTGRTDEALMRQGGGDWVCKSGADGLQAIGVRSLGLGIVVRVASGSPWQTHIATVEALHQIGLLDDPSSSPLGNAFRPVLRNASGVATGRYHSQFRLPRLVN